MADGGSVADGGQEQTQWHDRAFCSSSCSITWHACTPLLVHKTIRIMCVGRQFVVGSLGPIIPRAYSDNQMLGRMDSEIVLLGQI